jgi:hypothetical protein
LVGIFKHKNPGNAFLLLVYGLFLKFPMFLHPAMPVAQPGDNYVYQLILSVLHPLGSKITFIYPLLSFLLVFTQATLLNRMANSVKLFPRPNYLVGMSYLLVSSLMVEWSLFSAPLVINSLIIVAWYNMTGWFSSSKPKVAIFNTSVLIGALPLVYSPCVVFFLLIALALIITRPFRVTEWFVALLGLMTPYYFLFVVLYLNDQWAWSKILTPITFHLPHLPSSLWITGGIILLVLPFLIGAYSVQANLNKMLIQVRKIWSLLLVFLIAALLVIIINPDTSYRHWLLMALPMAGFHGAAYFFASKKWVALSLHWVTFLFIVVLHYFYQ